MSKNKKLIDLPIKKLSQWFESESRVLPWREDPSPYRVWISEIMLQQTQVVTVLPYFERFMSRFKTVSALARADEAEVMRLWAGLGYYSRARNLHRAAKILSENGFPKSRDEWLEIPGVGPYTAGAILSISENQAEPILDGNIERVFCRFFCISRDKEVLWSHSEAWVKRAHEMKIQPRILNQALMELGAMICTPKSPLCKKCPVNAHCLAFQNDKVSAYPPAKPKKVFKKVSESRVCLVLARRKILVSQAKAGNWREGLWDFPTQDELKARLIRVIKKGVRSESFETQHVVTQHKITRKTELIFFEKTPSGFKLGPDEKWIEIGDDQLAFGSAFKKTLKKVQTFLALS